MKKSTRVFIAQSLDGYISDRNGGLDWLNTVPNPEKLDMGYAEFIDGIDAIVMGRKTFESVCSFDIDWPYFKPVFVLSTQLQRLDQNYTGKAELLSGTPAAVLETLWHRGYSKIYVDGGSTIQGFLKEDLIDELIVTTFPILLGGGTRLFSDLPVELSFEHYKTEVFLDALVQSHYRRKKQKTDKTE